MKATVVIPIWNITQRVREISERCVRNFVRYSAECRVICIDNASTHPLRIPSGMPVEVVENKTNEGIAAAWNKGAKMAKTDIVVFANSDIFVRPGWLTPLARLLKERFCGVASVLEIGGEKDYENKMRAQERVTNAKVSGACFAMRKKTLGALGWFDEKIAPAYFEDVDMWFRLIEKGYYGASSSHSCADHIRKASCNQTKDKMKIWEKNLIYLKKKHKIKGWRPGSGWMGCLRCINEREMHGNSPLVEHHLRNI